MRIKKGKLVIVFMVFIAVNIVAFACTFFANVRMLALSQVDIYNEFIDDTISNLNNERTHWEWWVENTSPYIEGELNNDYVAASMDLYQRLARYYYEWSEKGYGDIHMYGATIDENRQVVAESGNKIILMQDTLPDEPEKVIYKYRFFDYENYLNDDEIKRINEFFKYRTGEMYMWGDMDDLYVYPNYLAWGNIDDSTTYENILTDNDVWPEDYDTYRDVAYDKSLFLYSLDENVNLKPTDGLVPFATYMEGNGLFYSEEDEYAFIADVEYFSENNLHGDVEHTVLPDIAGDELYKNAKENMLNAKDMKNYCNNSIFDYERICVVECESDGKIVYECYSYEGRPFDWAIDNISDYEYEQMRNFMIIFNILFIIVIIICLRIYLNRKNIYDEYTEQIFYEITDKLTEPISKLKEMNEATESVDEEKARRLIDECIVTMDRNIRDVLDLSKIESGMLKIEPQEIELGYLVENIINKKKGHYRRNIVTDIDENALVHGDIRMMATIIDCFICNVVKKTYFDENIYISVSRLKKRVHFEVTNNENMVMRNTYIGRRKASKSKKLENMEDGGLKLLLSKGYLDLHKANYCWNNAEGMVIYAFELSDKEFVMNEKKNVSDVKKIYGIVAHEIKTPMNVIKLHNELIREGVLDAETERHYKEIIAGQIDIIKNQLKQLDNARNLEEGNAKLIFEKIDIGKLIYEVRNKYKVLILDKGIEVDIQVPKESMMIADKLGMESIISNYFINAIKYTKIGGKINIRVQNTGEYAIVRIVNDVLVDFCDDASEFKKQTRIINRIERDGIGLLIANRYLKIHKAKFGCKYDNETVEYWFKIKKFRAL